MNINHCEEKSGPVKTGRTGLAPMPLFLFGDVEEKKRSDVRCIKQLHVPVYCSCRMPVSFSNEMIQCRKCGKWSYLDICGRVEDVGVDWHCT